jgi:hypothetical protein
MRDSLVLRQRLISLACLPALIALSGCDGGAAPADGKESDGKVAKAQKASKEDRKAKLRADADKTVDPGAAARMRRERGLEADQTAQDHEQDHAQAKPAAAGAHAEPGEGEAHHAHQAAPPPGTDPRYLPIAGDPPFVDGYNPEEETCPSGNWCGTAKTAGAIAPKNDATPPVMGCPGRIVGGIEPSPIKGPEYEGLSSKRQMQGAFNEGRTKKWRADGKEDACCYHWFEYCSGRPLLDGTESVVAEARGTSTWIDPDVLPVLEGLTDDARGLLARAWLDDALREHASIASFSRAAIELLAVGAPPDLVDGCLRAGQDEVDHARRCFALASAYAGRPLGPAALPPLGPRTRELAELAVETFLEGCVGETIAALVAERSLRAATDEAVRATLRVIVEDESRHAALAWRTVAWVLTSGSPLQSRGVSLALGAMLQSPPQLSADGPSPVAARCRAMLAAHGRLDPASLTEAVDDAWRDIIVPMLRSMLVDAEGDRPTPSA